MIRDNAPGRSCLISVRSETPPCEVLARSRRSLDRDPDLLPHPVLANENSLDNFEHRLLLVVHETVAASLCLLTLFEKRR